MSPTYWSAPGIKISINAKMIIALVCKKKNLDIKDVLSKKRQRPLPDTRFLMFHLMKKFTKMSLKSIGQNVGGRDHSTVIHGLQSFQNMLDTDPEFKREVERIEQKIL